MKRSLHNKIKRYFDYLLEYIPEKGYQPSDREAARELNLDKSTISSYKKKLEEMGLIERTGQGRSIVILNNDYLSKLGYARTSEQITNPAVISRPKQSINVKSNPKSRIKPISKDAILANVLLTLYQIWDKLGVVGLDETVPVPVELILKEEGYNLKKDTLQTGISGLLLTEDKIVIVSSQDSTQRHRFTVAHEIGHLKLHKNAGKLEDIVYIDAVDCSRKKDVLKRKEWEANYFALNLLVPLDKLREYIRSLKIEKEKQGKLELLVGMVAKKFSVSLVLAKSRLEAINIF